MVKQNKQRVKCRVPGCRYDYATKPAESRHYRLEHGGGTRKPYTATKRPVG